MSRLRDVVFGLCVVGMSLSVFQRIERAICIPSCRGRAYFVCIAHPTHSNAVNTSPVKHGPILTCDSELSGTAVLKRIKSPRHTLTHRERESNAYSTL